MNSIMCKNPWPEGQQKKPDLFLTRDWRPFTLRLARADQTLQDPLDSTMGRR